jgi:hypothetical protein
MSIFAEFESALFFSLSLKIRSQAEIAENKKTSKDHFTSNQAASESKLLKNHGGPLHDNSFSYPFLGLGIWVG